MDKSTCSVEECAKQAAHKGFCKNHYARYRANGNPMRPCVACGRDCPFGFGPKVYCSDGCIPKCGVAECARKASGRADYCSVHMSSIYKLGKLPESTWAKEKRCLVCGVTEWEGKGRNSCSDRCKQVMSRARIEGREIPRHLPLSELRQSEAPKEAAFTPKRCAEHGCTSVAKARTLCATHHQHHYLRGTLPSSWCKWCGAELIRGTSHGRIYCSDTCRPVDLVAPRISKPCERCSFPIDMATLSPSGRRRRSDIRMCEFCSAARTQRHKASIGEIVARDGQSCGICGDKVNLSLKSPNPASPNIDHVFPYSLGGSHDLENLQLSHMRCNQVKQNKVS